MRLGILTFHRSINNGAVLQCYSLSKKIAHDFPNLEVEVIDYNLPVIEKLYDVSLKKELSGGSFLSKIKRLVKIALDPFKIKKLKKRKKAFEQVLNVLPLSGETIISDDISLISEYINKNYDILVVGSDAVWNYFYRKFPNIYFPTSKISPVKLSYAASCYGMDYLKEETNREEIEKVFSGFEFLGVRDKATEDFVTWASKESVPVHTCDPTAFLEIEDLPIDVAALKNKLKQRGFDFSKETIGIMGGEKMIKFVRGLYGRKYQLVSLYEPVRGADVSLYDLTPYEWAYVFNFFKLTFTTYFHGTMLSLRNGVPLICVSLKTKFSKKYIPKTLDILTRLGYEDWYFSTDYKEENKEKIKAKADELLNKDLTVEIKERLDKEAESYCQFKKSLSNTIDNLQRRMDKK